MWSLLRDWQGFFMSILEGGKTLGPLCSACLAVLAVLVYSWSKNSASTRLRPVRRWSFTSLSMLEGVFPSSVQAPETVINVVAYFEDCPSVDDITTQVVEKLLEYERLATVPDLKLHRGRPPSRRLNGRDFVTHVVVHGDDTATRRPILERASASFSENDRNAPWWEIVLVENTGMGKSACVFRVHHGLGDGLSLVHVFSAVMTQPNGDPVKLAPEFQKLMQGNSHSSWRTQLVQDFPWGLWRFIKDFVDILMLPESRADDRIAFAAPNWSSVPERSSPTPTIVSLPAIDLSTVKAMKNATNTTVNTILLAVVSQTMKDYCKARGCPQFTKTDRKRVQCRALLAAALPRTTNSDWNDKALVLQNRFAMISLEIGVGLDLKDRLETIHRQVGRAKDTARLQYFLQTRVAPYLPRSYIQDSASKIFSRHTMGFSSVVGPSEPCLLAGKLISSLQVFFPSLLPVFTFVSYNNKLFGTIFFSSDGPADVEQCSNLYKNAFGDFEQRFLTPRG